MQNTHASMFDQHRHRDNGSISQANKHFFFQRIKNYKNETKKKNENMYLSNSNGSTSATITTVNKLKKKKQNICVYIL